MPSRDPWKRTPTPGVYRRGSRYRAIIFLPARRQRSRCFGTYEEAVRFKLDEQAKPRRGGPGRLYVLQRAGGGAVKIGYSRAARQRLGELQIGTEEPLLLVASYICPPAWEGLVHNYFAERHSRGEWFDVTASEVDQALILLVRFFRGGIKQEPHTLGT